MNLADWALTTFDQMLGTFDHMLDKAAGDPRGDVLLGERLVADMQPLATQVRFASHQVINTLNRLTGANHPTADGDPATIAEARAQLGELRELVRSASPAAFAADDAAVEFDLPNGMVFALTAAEYARDWSIPQFYFHVMSAYAILRQAGVPLGKADYVGYIARHAKMPVGA